MPNLKIKILFTSQNGINWTILRPFASIILMDYFITQIKCLPSAQHFLVHLEYVIIWLMLVLKTSDYWIQAGGTEFLPEKWVYLSQLIDQVIYCSQVKNFIIFSFSSFFLSEITCLFWTRMLHHNLLCSTCQKVVSYMEPCFRLSVDYDVLFSISLGQSRGLY